MAMRRRSFLKLAGAAGLSPAWSRIARTAETTGVYDFQRFGNARILHITDTHAQLLPVHFREPSVNIGIGSMAGQPPHLVGRAFLERFGIKRDALLTELYDTGRLELLRAIKAHRLTINEVYSAQRAGRLGFVAADVALQRNL